MTIKTLIPLLVILLVPGAADAAGGSLYLSPERGSYTIGDVFEIDVLADTSGAQVNAAEADLSFDPGALEVQSVATDGSVLSLWPTQPSYSNEKGTVGFSGTASKNFNKHDALLVRIIFKAKSALSGDVRFDSGALLAADNHASNIITAMRSGVFTLKAGSQTPAPEPASEIQATSSEVVPEVKGASVTVPTITTYDAQVLSGERIVLAGEASPDSTVTIYLKHENEAPQETVVATTHAGTFAYLASERAVTGTYSAWAAAGAHDELTSETVTIRASRLGLVAAIEAGGPPLVFGLPLLGALLVIACTYALLRRRN